MIKNSITVEDVINQLNRIWRADSEALSKLVINGAPCGEEVRALGDVALQIIDPRHTKQMGGKYLMGVLAVVNSFFGMDCDCGPIALDYGCACPGGCDLSSIDAADIGVTCPVCGKHSVEYGPLNQDEPFKDLRPAIKEFRKRGEEQGN